MGFPRFQKNVIGIPKCLSALSVCYGDIVCRCCQFVVRYGDIFPPDCSSFVPKRKLLSLSPKTRCLVGFGPMPPKRLVPQTRAFMGVPLSEGPIDLYDIICLDILIAV